MKNKKLLIICFITAIAQASQQSRRQGKKSSQNGCFLLATESKKSSTTESAQSLTNEQYLRIKKLQENAAWYKRDAKIMGCVLLIQVGCFFGCCSYADTSRYALENPLLAANVFINAPLIGLNCAFMLESEAVHKKAQDELSREFTIDQINEYNRLKKKK